MFDNKNTMLMLLITLHLMGYHFNGKKTYLNWNVEANLTMRVFLCGGGSREQTTEAARRFSNVIDHTKVDVVTGKEILVLPYRIGNNPMVGTTVAVFLETAYAGEL